MSIIIKEPVQLENIRIKHLDEPNRYIVLQAEDWSGFLNLGQHLKINTFGFFYRGHSNADWKLETTFHRLVNSSTIDFYDRLSLANDLSYSEWQSIKLFQSECKRINDFGDLEIDWLAAMQHHGVATRLLDFTNSLMVALFFASSESRNVTKPDACIWCINKMQTYRSLPTEILTMNREAPLQTEIAKYIIENPQRCKIECRNHANYLIKRDSNGISPHTNNEICGIIPVQPQYYNERISAQNGLFLMPCNISKSFLENLSNAFNIDPNFMKKEEVFYPDIKFPNLADYNIIKIILPEKILSGASDILEMSNISSKILFPGIDGVARSINNKIFKTFSI